MSDRQTAYLVYKLGEAPQQVVLWDTVDITVGRFRTQDVVVPDPEVSREHTVFQREAGSYFVKDRGTGLGTLVNGERVAVHELQHGDEVRIGPLRVQFGLTDKTLRPGGNTRFASELKAGVLPGATTEGNRTMLGFQADDEPRAGSAAPTRRTGPRALSADGEMEDLGASQADLAGFDTGDFDALLRSDPPLPGEPAPSPEDDVLAGMPTQPALEDLPTQPGTAGESGAAPSRPQAVAELRVELVGPAEALKALVDGVVDREIRIGDVEVRVRRQRR